MKVYFAGTPGAESRERNWQRRIKKRLLSFWDISQEQFSVPYAFALIMKRARREKEKEGKGQDVL